MRKRHLVPLLILVSTALAPLAGPLETGYGGEMLALQPLIDEALRNNHDVLLSESRVAAARARVPQAGSLPDPLFTVGYQNEGWNRYTYGQMWGSQWMLSASQMFPFPGKLSSREEMTERDARSVAALHESVRLNTIARVRELYQDLAFAHKNLDLIRDRAALVARVEEAAVARYASGTGAQQEVLMAQTEKYMLIEREEMQKQRIQALEAMLNSTVGREASSPLGRPREPQPTPFARSLEETTALALQQSPDVRAKELSVGSSEAALRMTRKEYYPDVTVTGSVFKRTGEFEDMWSLTTMFNIPLFYRDKQRQAVNLAAAVLSGAQHEYEASKTMLAASIRDTYSMFRTAERLMSLYRDALIPKARQDFELALSAYTNGKTDALMVITKMKSSVDYESLYWEQLAAREKAVARLDALAGISDTGATK